jgi:foldase protein PrsA
MRFVRYILALGAFFVVGATLSACGSGVSGNSVADVAGNPLTKDAFAHWMYVAAKGQAVQSPGAPVIIPDPPKFTTCVAALKKQVPASSKISDAQLKTDCSRAFTQMRDQVMDFLIRAYWYQADAASQGVNLSNAQVQTAFNKAKQQQFPSDAQFQQFLNQSGMTLNDILFRVRVNQLYSKLIKKAGSSVSDKDVQAYYQGHTSQFGTPEHRNLRIVLAKTKADAQKAMNGLSHGATWKATAAKYSTDPSTKSKGGLLVGISKGQQDQALDKAAFSAPAQKVVGPVQGQFGYYVFKVTSIKAGSQQTLAQATPTIKQILMQQGQQNAQNKVDSHARKRYLARTDCRSGFLMNDCKGFKAPARTTPSTGGAAPQGQSTVPPGAVPNTTTTK